VVTGVDALGRPFVERTSSLIIIAMAPLPIQALRPEKHVGDDGGPHQESGQPPRTRAGTGGLGFNGLERCGSFFRWRWSWKSPAILGHRVPPEDAGRIPLR